MLKIRTALLSSLMAALLAVSAPAAVMAASLPEDAAVSEIAPEDILDTEESSVAEEISDAVGISDAEDIPAAETDRDEIVEELFPACGEPCVGDAPNPEIAEETSLVPPAVGADGDSLPNGSSFKLTVPGTENYPLAFDILSLLNTRRLSESVNTVIMDPDLMEAAMQRAAELSISYDHIRPDGSEFNTVNSFKAKGETIAISYNSASEVINAWLQHESNRQLLLHPNVRSVGVGVFRNNDTNFIVLLANDSSYSSASRISSRTSNRTVSVKVINSKPLLFLADEQGYMEASRTIGKTNSIFIFSKCLDYNGLKYYGVSKPQGCTWTSANTTYSTISSSGVVSYKKPGVSRITAKFGSPAATLTIRAWTFFDDVQDYNKYYFNPVYFSSMAGITSGKTARTFAPDENCTRAQVVTFLWRACDEPKARNRKNPFRDVPAGSYYYEAVLWAVEAGITTGTSANTFSPNDSCTRGQVVTFLYRTDGSPAVSGSNPFKDVSSSAYYKNAVLWASKNNVTQGTSSTTFSPNNKCTRGQIVTFLYRVLTS